MEQVKISIEGDPDMPPEGYLMHALINDGPQIYERRWEFNAVLGNGWAERHGSMVRVTAEGRQHVDNLIKLRQ